MLWIWLLILPCWTVTICLSRKLSSVPSISKGILLINSTGVKGLATQLKFDDVEENSAVEVLHLRAELYDIVSKLVVLSDIIQQQLQVLVRHTQVEPLQVPIHLVKRQPVA